MKFHFGGNQHERLEVAVRSYLYRDKTSDYYSSNLLDCQISVAAGGFRGVIDAYLETQLLAAFESELRVVYETLNGTATLANLEGELSANFSGDGRGHIDPSWKTL